MTEQTNTQQRTAVGSNGPGVASLVLGIIALLVAAAAPGGISSIVAVTALAFGLAGAVRGRDIPGASKGHWIAGIVLAVAALALDVIY